ncbi:hypothetical protein BGX28_006871 [Mortierella sp. GBA30]|nr:hypothetical protein BGX28_006871 [Mortierella sp. GBA30]
MRKTWSVKAALAVSFLKSYLRYSERLTIEECQERSRSIPFMTAPAGIRVKKVKIPAFPWRSKAEAIVLDCLTEQEKNLLHLDQQWNNGRTKEAKEPMSIRVQQSSESTTLASMKNDAGHNNGSQDCHDDTHHGSQYAQGLDAEWLEYIGSNEFGPGNCTNDNAAAVLYFHGGGYYTGSKEEHRVLIGPLVKRLGKNIRILTVSAC